MKQNKASKTNGQTTAKKNRQQLGLRLLCSGAAAAIFAAVFLHCPGLSHTVTMMAAGIQHPENAAAYLADQLSDGAAAVSTTPTGIAATVPTAAQDRTEPTAPAAATTTAVSSAAAASIPPPGEDGSGGKIVERKLDTGSCLPNSIAVKNRSGTAVDIDAALKATLTQKFEKTAEPQVLIIHTHTTEGYMLYDAGYYNAGDRARKTGNEERTVCAVGKAVVQTLAQAGIAAIQDTTVHDSPVYSGAYTRSAETVENNLKKYPSIRVVLDLHRDAILEGDTGLVKPTVTVNGRKAAQMMIIAGVVSTGTLPHPNWEQNLALAAQWQRALMDVSPDLMRPLSTVASRYNQHLSTGYLLVEVGSEGNTVAEAVYSGELLGKTLTELLQ